LTGVNAGVYNGGTTFSNFNTIVGGTSADTFQLNGGSISGGIDGGDGIDTIQGAINNDTLIVTGANAVTVEGTNFTSIEAFDGGGGTNTVEGTGGNDVFTLTGTGAGNIQGISFTTIASLEGQGGDDDFRLNEGVNFGGLIVGGDGLDRLDYSTYSSDVAIDLATSTATGVTGFSEIERIDGGSGANDTVQGTIGADTFTITASNTFTVAGFSITAVENLAGQGGDDAFVLAGGSVASLDGGAGANTLIGDDIATTWNLTGADAGTVNGVVNFTNIQNLNGGSDTDIINFATVSARVSGNIDGGAGALILTGDEIS
jgi:hypothetical protein